MEPFRERFNCDVFFEDSGQADLNLYGIVGIIDVPMDFGIDLESREPSSALSLLSFSTMDIHSHSV